MSLLAPGYRKNRGPLSVGGSILARSGFQQPDFEAFVDLKRNWAEYKRKHGIA